jgi:hypothetical protein
MLTALTIAETLPAPGAELTALQCGIVVAGFGAMVGWTRRNRAALDRMDWCACAGTRVTMRVIPSHRSGRALAVVADVPVPVESQTPVVVELEEVAR